MSTRQDKSQDQQEDAVGLPRRASRSFPKWSRKRKLFSAAIVLVVLASIALVFLPHLVPNRSLRALLESELAKDLAREVKIHSAEWPKWGHIKLRGVDIHAREGFGRQSLVKIERLEMSHRILPLLWGKLAIDELEINSSAISISKNELGELCVADLIGKPPPPLSIRRLTLKSGSCRFTDKASGETFSARGIQLTFNRHGAREPILYRLKFEFADAGEPAKVEVSGEFQAPSSEQESSSDKSKPPSFLFNGKVEFTGIDISQKLPADSTVSVGHGGRLLSFSLKDASGEATIDCRVARNSISQKKGVSSDEDGLKADISTNVRLANVVLNITKPARPVANGSPPAKEGVQQNQLAVLAIGGVSLSSEIECDLSTPSAPEQKAALADENHAAAPRRHLDASLRPRSVKVKALSLESDLGNLTTSGRLTFENDAASPSVRTEDVSVDLNADVTLDTEKTLALLAPLVTSLPEELMVSGKTRIRLLSIKGRPSDLSVVGHLNMADNAIRWVGIGAGDAHRIASSKSSPRGDRLAAHRHDEAGSDGSNRPVESGKVRQIKKAKEPTTLDFEVVLKPDSVELKELKLKSVPVNGLVSAQFERTKEGLLVDVRDLDVQLKSESLLSSLPPELFALPEELKISGWTKLEASGKARPDDSYASASISVDLTNNAITYIPARQLRALKAASRSAKGPKLEAVTASIKELTPIIIKRKNDSETLDLKIVLRKSAEDVAPSVRSPQNGEPPRNVLEIKKLAWKSSLGVINLSGKVGLPLENADFDLRTDAEIDVKRLERFSTNRKSPIENRKSKDWNISGKSRLTLNIKGTTDEKAIPKTLSLNGALNLTNNSLVYTGTAIKPAGEEVNIDFSAEATEKSLRLKQLALVSPTDSIVFSGEAKGEDALKRALQMEDFDSLAITVQSNVDAERLLGRVPELLLSRHQIPTIPDDVKVTGKTQCFMSAKGTPRAFDFNCSIDMSRNSIAHSNLLSKEAMSQPTNEEGALRLSLKGKWQSESPKLARASRGAADKAASNDAKSPKGAGTPGGGKPEGVKSSGEIILTDSRLELGDAVFAAEGKLPVSFATRSNPTGSPRSSLGSYFRGQGDLGSAGLNVRGRIPRLDSLAGIFPFLKDCKFEGGLAFSARAVNSSLGVNQLSGSLTFDNASITCGADATPASANSPLSDSTSTSERSKIGIHGRIDFTPTSLTAEKLKLRVNDSVLLTSVNFESPRPSDGSPATGGSQRKSAKLRASLDAEKIDADSIALAVKQIQERWKRATEGLQEKKKAKDTTPGRGEGSALPSNATRTRPTVPSTPRWLATARSLSFSGDIKVDELLIGQSDSGAGGEAQGIYQIRNSKSEIRNSVSLVRNPKFEIRDLKAPITLEDGVLKIAGLSLTLNEGQVAADLEARLNPQSVELEASDESDSRNAPADMETGGTGDDTLKKENSAQGMTYNLHVRAAEITVADNVRDFLESVSPDLKGGDKFDFESHGKGDIIVKDDLLEALEASLNTQRGESILDVTGGYMEGQGATDVMVKLFPAWNETRYPLKSTHIESTFSPEESHSKMYFNGQSIDMYMEGTTNNVTKEIDYWMSVDLIANLGLSPVRDKIPGPIKSASKIDIMHYTGNKDDRHVDFLEPKSEEVADRVKGLFLVKDAMTLFNPDMSPKEKTEFFRGRMQLLFGPAKALKDGAPELFKIYKKIGRLIKGPFSLFKWKKKTEEQKDSQN